MFQLKKWKKEKKFYTDYFHKLNPLFMEITTKSAEIFDND